MCITPHSAMDNTIHSIWKSKSSFPTSCKQCCPQLHKTESYTHCPQCRRRRNPTHFFLPCYKKQKNSLQTRPYSCNIVYKSAKKQECRSTPIPQNKRMNEHVGIFQLKLCIFTKEYSSNTLYLTSKIVYTMPEIYQIIV